MIVCATCKIFLSNFDKKKHTDHTIGWIPIQKLVELAEENMQVIQKVVNEKGGNR